MNYLQALILAIIEGITEFLPISSTGHMIIASSIMGIESNEFVKMFTVAIQFGAILSVLSLYWKRFVKDIEFYKNLLIAFLPAAIIGFLLNDLIDAMLENVLVVAISLIIGGIVLLFVDKCFNNSTNKINEVYSSSAFKIGLFQVIAMIPGVSRSGATIVGGLFQKLTKQTAAEFSFFLAVPTMFAATAYKMLKYFKTFGLHQQDIPLLAVGNIVAFIVAYFAIKYFITFVVRHGFFVFGIYRIIVGGIIVIMWALGINLQLL